MFLAEIAAIRNDLGLRCLCLATAEKVKSAPKMAESERKIAILIYYHVKVREHVSSCKLTSLILCFLHKSAMFGSTMYNGVVRKRITQRISEDTMTLP